MTNPAIVLETFKSPDTNGYDAGKLSASIKLIATNGAKLDARIHATACALLERAAEHFDCSMVPALLNAMPKSSRRKALIAWFGAYSNVHIREEKGGKFTVTIVKTTSKLYKAPRPSEAFANPFWSVEEKDQDPAAFDRTRFAAAIASLIKRAESDNAQLDAESRAALADLKLVGVKLAPVA